MSVLSSEVRNALDSSLSEVPEFRVILIQLFEDYVIQTEEPKAVDLPSPESVKREANEISPQPSPAEKPAEGNAESEDDFY